MRCVGVEDRCVCVGRWLAAAAAAWLDAGGARCGCRGCGGCAGGALGAMWLATLKGPRWPGLLAYGAAAECFCTLA